MTQEVPPADPSRDASRSDPRSDTGQTLKQAVRRARYDDAERSGVQADLRTSQIGRLELLQDALKPLLTQIPGDAEDIFDVGLMPGATPRLFIDMIGFVEMGRDSRLYRLIQDTRYTRLTIAESADLPVMVDAVTQYVARRLLEREKALAAARGGLSAGGRSQGAASARRQPSRAVRWIGAAFAFVIDLLGALAFFTILALAGWLLWNRLHGRG